MDEVAANKTVGLLQKIREFFFALKTSNLLLYIPGFIFLNKGGLVSRENLNLKLKKNFG